MKKQAKEFITEKLNELYAQFEGIRIRYEYNKSISTHIVEVLPLSTFEDNEEYVLAEMHIEEEFEKLFGEEEEILFISEESLNQIEEATFTLGYNSDVLEFVINLIEQSNISTPQFDNELTPIDPSTQKFALAA